MSLKPQLVCRHGAPIEHCALCQPSSPSQAYQELNAHLDELLEEARPRLLRLAKLNGIVADAVDDVVQETYVEAWRHLEQLREPERFAAWLDGICRNVCRRQIRAQTTHACEGLLAAGEADTADFDVCDSLVIDPAEALEHQDRQILLDRALGYLSESARKLIELCYLTELPQREVAQRLDMSLGALELKLHRARKQLRQVLNGQLRADAREFGLLLDEEESMGWQETRRWCYLCGKQRLRGTFERLPSGIVQLRLRCPDCSKQYNIDLANSDRIVQLDGLHSFQTALKRAVQAAATYFSAAIREHRCTFCQSSFRLRVVAREEDERLAHCPPAPLGISLRSDCPGCGTMFTNLWTALLIYPAVQDFLLQRPRVIFEPDILTMYNSQETIRSSLLDLNRSERLMIITHPESLQVLAITLN